MKAKVGNLRWFIVLLISVLLVLWGCDSKENNEMTNEFRQFLKEYEAKVIPLAKAYNLAYFNATISGKAKDYQKSADLEIQLTKIYTNRDDFAKLKKWKASGAITDPLLKRQLDLLYNAYLEHQIDEKKLEAMIKLQTEIERKFSTFRAEVNGKKLTDNEIEEILKTSTDSRELKAAWEASKEVGALVAPEVLRLVKMRNEAARELGFKNFHEMRLVVNEQDPEKIKLLFDELDDLTRSAFEKLKREEIDPALAKRYGIKPSQLMPWHYQNRFFQEAPKIYKVDLDQYYQNQDLVKLTRDFYDGIGLPIDDLIKHSDLYEKEGKYQHAYCTDIDREGDVRVVANVKPNMYWMNTLLHEFGHAVYDKFHDPKLPWTLREPAHIFTTEAIAMLFGRFAANPAWLKDMGLINPVEEERIAPDCFRIQRLEQLVFSRWAQVMYRFEKSMYENPDQDLNALWWELKEKYQLLKKPAGRNAPDWASKIHIATVPAYYHNYLMGELLASQLFYHISKDILHAQDLKEVSFVNRPEVGKYLIEYVFKPGKRYPWNEMIRRATGEYLTPSYFAKQFVGE